MTGTGLLVVAHASAALVALPLGAFQLFRRPRGDLRHRRVGRVWVLLMLWVAFSSFWIRDLRDGRFSFLHVLSVVTVVSVVLGVVMIRRGNVRAHEANLRGAWIGLAGAFVGAVAVPGRLLPTFALERPLSAAVALVAVGATYLLVVTVAGLPAGRPGGPRTPVADAPSGGAVPGL